MKRIICAAMAVLAACSGKDATEPLRRGDLAFVGGRHTGMSEAIVASTSRDDGFAFDHVAIIDVDSSGAAYVIEATAEAGVRCMPWRDFVELNGARQIVVKRLACDFDADASVRCAMGYVGKEYDWYYMPGDSALYCSELVQLSYADGGQRPIFQAAPMNFLDAEGCLPDFWRELFEREGLQVPQGLPGTNPNEMSRDSRLITINFNY